MNIGQGAFIFKNGNGGYTLVGHDFDGSTKCVHRFETLEELYEHLKPEPPMLLDLDDL